MKNPSINRDLINQQIEAIKLEFKQRSEEVRNFIAKYNEYEKETMAKLEELTKLLNR